MAAVLVAACGDTDDVTATTTIAASDLGLDRPVAVTNTDGVFQIGTNGSITTLFQGTVSVAVDDTQGGLVYQARSGRRPELDDRATIVRWIPKGTGTPQELLVPSPSAGHRLTLHDTYPTQEGFAVLYTRHETEHPVDELIDGLRRFDLPQRQVTELYSQGAFEQGYSEVSAGGELISGISLDQVSSGCFIFDLDGRPTDLVPLAANDPTREGYVTGCRLSPDGTRLAFVTEDAEGAIVHLWRLGGAEEAQFAIPPSAGRVGSIDLSERAVLVNLERDGPLPAIVFDLGAPDAAPQSLRIAGIARFLSESVEIESATAAPSATEAGADDQRAETTSTVPPSTTALAAQCSAAGEQIPAAQEDLPAPVAALRSEILTAATACDFDRLNELAIAGDPPFTHTDVLVEEYQNMTPGEFWLNAETRGAGILAQLVHDLSQSPEIEQHDGLGAVYVWRDPTVCELLDDVLLCRQVEITEAGDWIAFYSESA